LNLVPYDLTALLNGHVVVRGEKHVHMYSDDGRHLVQFDLPDNIINTLYEAWGVANHNQRLLLTESRGVLVYNMTGKHEQTLKLDVEEIDGNAVYRDRMYVTSYTERGAVYYVDLNYNTNSINKVLFVQHTDTHPLRDPGYIAADDRIVVVSCWLQGYLQVYDVTGEHLATLEDSTGCNSFRPHGVVIDEAGRIIVGDINNKCLVIFSSNGDVIARLSADNMEPLSLALSPTGTLWVGGLEKDKYALLEYEYI
jgi:WD40 repeat protein